MNNATVGGEERTLETHPAQTRHQRGRRGPLFRPGPVLAAGSQSRTKRIKSERDLRGSDSRSRACDQSCKRAGLRFGRGAQIEFEGRAFGETHAFEGAMQGRRIPL